MQQLSLSATRTFLHYDVWLYFKSGEFFISGEFQLNKHLHLKSHQEATSLNPFLMMQIAFCPISMVVI